MMPECDFVEIFASGIFKKPFTSCPRTEEAGGSLFVFVGCKLGFDEMEGNFVLCAEVAEEREVGFVLDVGHFDMDGFEAEVAVVVPAQSTEEGNEGERVFASRKTDEDTVARGDEFVLMDCLLQSAPDASGDGAFLHKG